LCFEDIDAPATAAVLIFLAFAFIESAYQSPQRAELACLAEGGVGDRRSSGQGWNSPSLGAGPRRSAYALTH
jgi:hypothetical protein